MNIPSDVCLLIADHGIGDHYIVAGLAEAVRRRHNVHVWMAGRPHLGFVTGLFPSVEHYFDWPADADGAALGSWKIEGGKMFYAHFPKLELMRAVGYGGFHFLDAYRCRLDLPAETQLSRAKLPSPREVSQAGARLQAEGFTPGRSVVLSIEARSTPTDGIDATFWTLLAEKLQARGLDVLVNAAPTTQVPAGLRSLAVPLAELRELVQAAGFACSVRSGISDLVSNLRCPQAVIYPDVRYWSGPLFEGTTLSRFGLLKSPHEVVLRRDYTQEEVSALADYFAARVVPKPYIESTFNSKFTPQCLTGINK
ncbi:MAG: hypothetical protein H7343_15540 [Undibacterium sp.]|nr:hypothetical protein [Opitutaceae bacterium]